MGDDPAKRRTERYKKLYPLCIYSCSAMLFVSFLLLALEEGRAPFLIMLSMYFGFWLMFFASTSVAPVVSQSFDGSYETLMAGIWLVALTLGGYLVVSLCRWVAGCEPIFR